MNNKLIIFMYSAIHLVVDLSCAAFIYHFLALRFGITNIAIFILVYDFFAFVLQLPFGVFFNNKNINSFVSMIGCILILFAYLLNMIPILPVLLIGTGNAMFHIGGGIDILNISQKKSTKIGLYVAPGAFGLFLGCSINKINYSIYLILVLLVISIISLYIMSKTNKTKINQKNISILDYKFNKRIIIYLLLLTICIRGYIGFILNYTWKTDFNLALFAVLLVVFGKAIGGILGGKYGLEKIGFLSLLVSSILFVFSFNNMYIAFASILIFNMTMPITLILLSNYLNNYGRAFGLNTVALFIGSLLNFASVDLFHIVILPIVVFMSSIIFILCCKGMKKI